jgi:hypothetical protein
VEIDLSTNEVATSPLELDDETLTASEVKKFLTYFAYMKYEKGEEKKRVL